MRAETDQTTLPEPDVSQSLPDPDSPPTDPGMPGLVDAVHVMWPGATGTDDAPIATGADDAPIATSAETQTLPGDESDGDFPAELASRFMNQTAPVPPRTPEMDQCAPVSRFMNQTAPVAPVTPGMAQFAPVTEDELLKALADDADMPDDALEDGDLDHDDDDDDEMPWKKAKTDKD